MQNPRVLRKSSQGGGITVNIIDKRPGVTVIFDHHLEKGFSFLPEFAYAAFCLAFGHEIHDQVIRRCVKVYQKIEGCVSELNCTGRRNVSQNEISL